MDNKSVKIDLNESLNRINSLSDFRHTLKNKTEISFFPIQLTKSLLQNFEKIACFDFKANYIDNSIPQWSLQLFKEILSSTVSHDDKWKLFLNSIMRILLFFFNQITEYSRKDIYVWWKVVESVTIAVVDASNKHEDIKNAVLSTFAESILSCLITKSFYVDIKFLCHQYGQCVSGAKQDLRVKILANHSNLFKELTSMVTVSTDLTIKLVILKFLILWLDGIQDRSMYANQWFSKASIREAFCKLTFDNIDTECHKFLDVVEIENVPSDRQTNRKNTSSISVRINSSLLASQMKCNVPPDQQVKESRRNKVSSLCGTKQSMLQIGVKRLNNQAHMAEKSDLRRPSVVLVDCVKSSRSIPIRIDRKKHPTPSNWIAPLKPLATHMEKISTAQFHIKRSKLNVFDDDTNNLVDSRNRTTSPFFTIPHPRTNESGSSLIKNASVTNNFVDTVNELIPSDLSQHIKCHFTDLANKLPSISESNTARESNNLNIEISSANNNLEEKSDFIANADLNIQHLLDEVLVSSPMEKVIQNRNCTTYTEESNRMPIDSIDKNIISDNNSKKLELSHKEIEIISKDQKDEKHSEECIIDTPDRNKKTPLTGKTNNKTEHKIKISKKRVPKSFKIAKKMQATENCNNKKSNENAIDLVSSTLQDGKDSQSLHAQCAIRSAEIQISGNKSAIIDECIINDFFNSNRNEQMPIVERDAALIREHNMTSSESSGEADLQKPTHKDIKISTSSNVNKHQIEENIDLKLIPLIDEIQVKTPVRKQPPRKKKIKIISDILITRGIKTEEVFTGDKKEQEIKTLNETNMNKDTPCNVSVIQNVTTRKKDRQMDLIQLTPSNNKSLTAHKSNSFSSSKRRTLFSPGRKDSYEEIDNIEIPSEKKTRMPSNTLALSYSQIEKERATLKYRKHFRNAKKKITTPTTRSIKRTLKNDKTKDKDHKVSKYEGNLPTPSFSYRDSNVLTVLEEKHSKLFDSLLENKVISNKCDQAIDKTEQLPQSSVNLQNAKVKKSQPRNKKKQTKKNIITHTGLDNSEELFMTKIDKKPCQSKTAKAIGNKRNKTKNDLVSDNMLLDERIRSTIPIEKDQNTSFIIENIIIDHGDSDIEPDIDMLKILNSNALESNSLENIIKTNSETITKSIQNSYVSPIPSKEMKTSNDALSKDLSFRDHEISEIPKLKSKKTSVKSKTSRRVVFETQEDNNMPSLIIEKLPAVFTINESTTSAGIEAENYKLDSSTATNNISAVFNTANIAKSIIEQQTMQPVTSLIDDLVLESETEQVQVGNLSNYSPRSVTSEKKSGKRMYNDKIACFDNIDKTPIHTWETPIQKQLSYNIVTRSSSPSHIIPNSRSNLVENKHKIDQIIASGIKEITTRETYSRTNKLQKIHSATPSNHSINSIKAASETSEKLSNMRKYQTIISDTRSLSSLQSIRRSDRKKISTVDTYSPLVGKLKGIRKTEKKQSKNKQPNKVLEKIIIHKECDSLNSSLNQHIPISPSLNVKKWLKHKNERTVDYTSDEDDLEPYACSDLESRFIAILNELSNCSTNRVKYLVKEHVNKTRKLIDKVDNFIEYITTISKLMARMKAEAKKVIKMTKRCNNKMQLLLESDSD